MGGWTNESGAMEINSGLTDIYRVFKPWDWMRSLDKECGKRRPRTKPYEAPTLKKSELSRTYKQQQGGWRETRRVWLPRSWGAVT